MKLHNEDCIKQMQTMVDAGEQVDSVVTDPPYELGFMGKSWDSTGIAFQKETWELAYQLLKPGGHLLAFGGSRTYHRMAVAIEDAGFEIRDQIMWLYGCLSEDTEILTDEGWARYHKDINNSNVLCYDIENDIFSFDKPAQSYYYENKHPAYRIESNKTDQIVSRNHRVIVERDGRKTFQMAETCQFQEDIPFLESLSDLPNIIYYGKSISSITKQDLFDRVQKQSNRIEPKKKNWYQSFSRNIVFGLWNQKNETKRSSEPKGNLFTSLQRYFAWPRMEIAWAQGTGMLDGKFGTRLQRKNGWFDQSCMEGWSYLSTQTRKLQRFDIGKMPTKFFRNVKKEWLCFRTQIKNGAAHQTTLEKGGSGSSYRSRPAQQCDQKFNVIREQQQTQTIRSTRATIKKIKYEGNIWCVSVPSGAFVARRNGKIFITGNSGFPKSLNIGKAVDKKAGAKRKVVGQNQHPTSKDRTGNKSPYQAEDSHLDASFDITKGNSKWEGWGTALKPAHEPIVLARKPIEGTVTENVLKHGTGGINIDECRVETNEELGREQTEGPLPSKYGFNDNSMGNKFQEGNPQGRFPANVLHDGSEEVLEGFPTTSKSAGGGGMRGKGGQIYGKYKGKEYAKVIGFGDEGSAARFFYCAKVSKKERNRGLDNILDNTKYTGGNYSQSPVCKTCDKTLNGTNDHSSCSGEVYYRKMKSKQTKNHHPTVKPIELMRYLCKLITPKGGTILDPFMGSGSTGMAAKEEEFDFIGIEKEQEYFEIAEQRIKTVSPLLEFTQHDQIIKTND